MNIIKCPHSNPGEEPKSHQNPHLESVCSVPLPHPESDTISRMEAPAVTSDPAPSLACLTAATFSHCYS
jgi:hypothetical protein